MESCSSEIDHINFDEATKYLTEIQNAFKDDMDKYREFLTAMTNFKENRIDMECLMSRVKEIFKGHKKLLLKFNTFLPDGEEDEVSSGRNKPVVNLEYAKKYLANVKNRFQHEPHIFQSFIDTVNMYRYQDKSAEEIWHMVISLFEGHQDLIDGFSVFVW